MICNNSIHRIALWSSTELTVVLYSTFLSLSVFVFVFLDLFAIVFVLSVFTMTSMTFAKTPFVASRVKGVFEPFHLGFRGRGGGWSRGFPLVLFINYPKLIASRISRSQCIGILACSGCFYIGNNECRYWFRFIQNVGCRISHLTTYTRYNSRKYSCSWKVGHPMGNWVIPIQLRPFN